MGIDNARKGGRRSHSLLLFKADSLQSSPVPGTMGELLSEFTNRLREKALRSAAYAGAKVFYEEMQRRAEGAEQQSPNVKSGTLRGAIYHWHDEQESRAGTRQVYAVGPNKAKAPHWFNVEYGHFRYNHLIPIDDGRVVKNGTKVVVGHDGQRYIATRARLSNPEQVPAYPYIRPTFDAMAKVAVDRMRERLGERIKELQSGAE